MKMYMIYCEGVLTYTYQPSLADARGEAVQICDVTEEIIVREVVEIINPVNF